MLYPYKHQFLLFDDIKDALTGFGRFIEYRCMSKNRHDQPDPTCDNRKGNWVLKIKEGQFYKGMADGYQRQLVGMNGHCKVGYFYEDEPYGKFVEYDINEKEW